jgi:hypothetical protein
MNRPKQLTIGETIAALKAVEYNNDADVRFDFGYFVPYRAESYRGFYNQLALGYGPHNPQKEWEKQSILKTPAKVIQELEGAIGRTYEGYKGGDFVMRADTPLWVANRGDANETGVIGVRSVNYTVIIETRFVSWDEVHYDEEAMILRALASARFLG